MAWSDEIGREFKRLGPLHVVDGHVMTDLIMLDIFFGTVRRLEDQLEPPDVAGLFQFTVYARYPQHIKRWESVGDAVTRMANGEEGQPRAGD